MKRGYLGTGFLAVLLILSLLVTRGMDTRTAPVANTLTAAANNAMAQNWDAAEKLTETAFSQWQESRPFTSAFADHSPLEDVEDDFAQLKIYLRAKDKTSFAGTAAQLAKKIEAVGEAHALHWQNIL